MAQTRNGAISILNSGIFGAIRDSELFATDPDVGIDIDNPEALKKFFDLMLSVLRIINSIILKYQSDQAIKAAQEFLAENRPSIIGILKRFAGVGGVEIHESINLDDLVDNLTLLISATNFLEVCERTHNVKLLLLTLISSKMTPPLENEHLLKCFRRTRVLVVQGLSEA
jgi:nuclear pore complex protein Nup205